MARFPYDVIYLEREDAIHIRESLLEPVDQSRHYLSPLDLLKRLCGRPRFR